MIIRHKKDLVFWVVCKMSIGMDEDDMESDIVEVDKELEIATDLAVRISKWGGKLCPEWGADWSFFLLYFSHSQSILIPKIIQGVCPGCEEKLQAGHKIFCPKCDPIAKGDLQLLARAGEVGDAIETAGMEMTWLTFGAPNELGWSDWEWIDIAFLDMRGKERVVRVSKFFGDRGSFDLNVVLGANFEPNRIERVCSILEKGIWDNHDCYGV